MLLFFTGNNFRPFWGWSARLRAHRLQVRTRVRQRRSMRGVTAGARSRVRHRLVRWSRGIIIIQAYSPTAPARLEIRDSGGIYSEEKQAEARLRGRACVHTGPSIRAAAEAGSGIFLVPGLRAACAFEAATGRRGRAERSPEHGGDAGVRSRESRRSLRPHHLLPAATDHHPHRVVGKAGSLSSILGQLVHLTCLIYHIFTLIGYSSRKKNNTKEKSK